MTDLWQWLINVADWEKLSWIVGVLAGVVGLVFLLFKSNSGSVRADRGGIAAGRDIHVNQPSPHQHPKD